MSIENANEPIKAINFIQCFEDSKIVNSKRFEMMRKERFYHFTREKTWMMIIDQS